MSVLLHTGKHFTLNKCRMTSGLLSIFKMCNKFDFIILRFYKILYVNMVYFVEKNVLIFKVKVYYNFTHILTTRMVKCTEDKYQL